MVTGPRWHAIATYRGTAGPIEVVHDIEELEELQDLIERGPDWNALIEIKVTLARRAAGEPVVIEAVPLP